MAVGVIGVKREAPQLESHHGGKYRDKIARTLDTIGKNGIRMSPIAGRQLHDHQYCIDTEADFYDPVGAVEAFITLHQASAFRIALIRNCSVVELFQQFVSGKKAISSLPSVGHSACRNAMALNTCPSADRRSLRCPSPTIRRSVTVTFRIIRIGSGLPAPKGSIRFNSRARARSTSVGLTTPSISRVGTSSLSPKIWTAAASKEAAKRSIWQAFKPTPAA